MKYQVLESFSGDVAVMVTSPSYVRTALSEMDFLIIYRALQEDNEDFIKSRTDSIAAFSSSLLKNYQVIADQERLYTSAMGKTALTYFASFYKDKAQRTKKLAEQSYFELLKRSDTYAAKAKKISEMADRLPSPVVRYEKISISDSGEQMVSPAQAAADVPNQNKNLESAAETNVQNNNSEIKDNNPERSNVKLGWNGKDQKIMSAEEKYNTAQIMPSDWLSNIRSK